MLALLGAFVILGFVGLLTVGFVSWSMREHVHAQQYRRLKQMEREVREAIPWPEPEVVAGPIVHSSGNNWEVSYQAGAKKYSMVVEANTEEIAIGKVLAQTRCDPRSICSVTRK